MKEMITQWVIGGGLLGLMGLILKNNKDYDDKVNRVFTRLDEVKKINDEKYTSRDVCTVRHEQLSLDIKDVRLDIRDVKDELKEINLFLRTGKKER